MIPKVIHTCWFGGAAKGKLIEDCIQSWREQLPDYEIREWNESNFKSDSFFYQYAIRHKKYAFASDLARFEVLNREGGIYLDTDMLFLHSMNDCLQHKSFFGFEDETHVSCGVIGSEPNHPLMQLVCKRLHEASDESFFKGYTIVKLLNDCLKQLPAAQHPYVYPVDVFYPYPYAAGGDPMQYATSNTIAIHLWNASWFGAFERAKLLYQQGKKGEARLLYLHSLLRQPRNIRFLQRFF